MKFKFGKFITLLSVFAIAACGASGADDADFSVSINDVIAHAKTLSKKDSSEEFAKTGTPNFDVPSAGYDGSAVTLKFYHTMGSNLSTVLEKYIEQFNVLYPNITIDHSQVGGYDDVRDQISTELTVGGQPNLAYCYPDHVALYNMAKAVANLDNLIDSTATVTRADGTTETLGLTQAQKDDFIEGYYNEGRQFGDGLMYSMPFSKSTEVLYYNETFFTENNIPVPTHWFNESENDTTSLEAVARKIKQLKPSSIPLGYDSESNWFITMAEQCGADYTTAKAANAKGHFLFNNDTMKTICKKFREWYQEGLITTQTLYGSYTSGLFIDSSENNSYMSIGSSAGATHQRPEKDAETGKYPFNVGIASIPQMSQNYKRVISQGPSVTIFKKANAQEVVASWLFVKYLTTSVRFQAEFAQASGYVPVIKSVGENAVYKAELEKADGGDFIASLSAKVCMEQKDAYYTSPAFNGSSQARSQVGSMLSKILATTTETPNRMINNAFKDAIDECVYAIS